jgi:hypothetical protein
MIETEHFPLSCMEETVLHTGFKLLDVLDFEQRLQNDAVRSDIIPISNKFELAAARVYETLHLREEFRTPIWMCVWREILLRQMQ